MIQRYDFDIVNGGYEESDTGEWVKWDDVKHLVLINEALNICTKLPENYDFFQKPIDIKEFLKEIKPCLKVKK